MSSLENIKQKLFKKPILKTFEKVVINLGDEEKHKTNIPTIKILRTDLNRNEMLKKFNETKINKAKTIFEPKLGQIPEPIEMKTRREPMRETGWEPEPKLVVPEPELIKKKVKVKKQVKPKIKFIIEEDEDEEEIEIVIPKKKGKKIIAPKETILGPETIVEIGETTLKKRFKSEEQPTLLVSSYFLNNRKFFINFRFFLSISIS